MFEASTATRLLSATWNPDFVVVADVGPGEWLLAIGRGFGAVQTPALARDALIVAARAARGAPAARLTDAFAAVDRRLRVALCAYLEDDGFDLCPPGAIVTAALVDEQVAHVAWVGDARAWWLRDRHVRACTVDHTLAQTWVDAGRPPVPAVPHVILRSLGGRAPSDPAIVEVAHLAPWHLAAGDRLILTTAGVHAGLDHAAIARLATADEPPAAVQALVDAAGPGDARAATAMIARWLPTR